MEQSILGMIAGFMPSGPPVPPTAKKTPDTRGAPLNDAKTTATASDGERLRDVHMICFSKDRAFQLDQLLESANRHLQLTDEDQVAGAPVTLRISVLYTFSAPPPEDSVTTSTATAATATRVVPTPAQAVDNHDEGITPRCCIVSGSISVRTTAGHGQTTAVSASGVEGLTRSMEDSYDLVRQRHPAVTFIHEKPGMFCDQLLELLANREKNRQQGGVERFVLFAVDDMLFYRDFNLPGALRVLSSDSSVLCVHLRLHPGITWSHTAGSPCNVPPLSHVDLDVELGASKSSSRAVAQCSSTETGHICEEDGGRSTVAAEFSVLTFARKEGTGEWDYPWDLTGGLYRIEDAMVVLRGIVGAFGQRAASNPNLLEYHGHRLLSQKWQDRTDQSDPRRPRLLSPASDEHSSLVTEKDTLDLATESASPAPPSVSPTDGNAGFSTAAAIKAASHAPRCACSGRAVVSSLAVNRVQSTYSTPVYESAQGGILDLDHRLWSCTVSSAQRIDGKQELAHSSTEKDDETGALSECAATGGGSSGRLDGSAYRRRAFASVHVGQLFFEDDPEDTLADATQEPTGRDPHAHQRRDRNSVVGEESMPPAIRGHQDCSNLICRGSGDHQRRVNSRSVSEGSRLLSNACNEALPKHSVTVLLPVKNGGAHLMDAVQSVRSCAQRMLSEWKLELLIVDDGSDDGAVERALAAVGFTSSRRGYDCSGENIGKDTDKIRQEVAGSGTSFNEVATTEMPAEAHCDVSAATNNTASAAVHNEEQAAGEDARGNVPRKCFEGGAPLAVRVIRHERTLGVAESLNEGLREAKSELIARMDADDVCIPERFHEQATFMISNPSITVLGSSVATFSGECVRTYRSRRQNETDNQAFDEAARIHLPATQVQRIVRYPTDRAFISWSLLFGCCIAHPSVMLRRDRVIDAGGYDPGTEPAEDYDLWLRMDGSVPGCLANAGEVLLGLRKHDHNVSRVRQEQQRKAALTVAAKAMSRLLGREVTKAQAAAIRTPESALSAGDLAEGSRLLCDLETAVLGRNYDGFGIGQERKGEVVGEDHERLWPRELIVRDAEARLGALVVHAMKSFGGEATPVLDAWNRRYPDRPLLRVLGGGM